ncbi:MspA family porin [Mycolicibacterium goodii]|uniref:MspA family porin n=1 Tax=Mycolicibacterium goodii TaxID=134601 RepID=UPI001BDC931C|nr:MspA family porin [Mycolicibacterium goodii]MBU8829762.1 MspA family porin [Mycolicibacterium goodii]
MERCNRRRSGRRLRHLLIVAITVISASASHLGVATAAGSALNSEETYVDDLGRALRIQQWNNDIQAVHAMERNRLTREWFFSGLAVYEVAGPRADEFTGQLSLGYQVGFPWSMGVGINLSYTTPNVMTDGTTYTPGPDFAPLAWVLTPNLLPGASVRAELGNGPGVREVVTFLAEVAGARGDILVTDAHGTVTGASGGVLLRPFARLTSHEGDSVTTYGQPWTAQ